MREWIIWYDDIMSEHTSGELVRCRDCRWWFMDENYDGLYRCANDGLIHKSDWYCADGERRDDGKNREDDL